MREASRWFSPRLHQEVTAARWGHWGSPVLLFPTAGGDAFECERHGLVDAVGHLLEAGRIKVYSCDSVAGRAWVEGGHSARHRSWLQNRYDSFVYEELVPAIRTDCRSPSIEVMSAGASIGAFNAVASLCRHPDVFRAAIGMSGTYDLEGWLGGHFDDDFYFSSPLHFLPNLGDGPRLEALRRRFVVLATGEGRWEDPGESWRMAHVLGSKGVPNRVDLWGPEHDHDWPTWRSMLPRYLEELS